MSERNSQDQKPKCLAMVGFSAFSALEEIPSEDPKIEELKARFSDELWRFAGTVALMDDGKVIVGTYDGTNAAEPLSADEIHSLCLANLSEKMAKIYDEGL